MVNIFTKAYNAEKVLHRCVDSILTQTYGDFRYYLLDNGSKDATRRVITDYSVLDKRIRPIYFKDNRVGIIEEILNIIYQDSNDDDYFCMLDADDEYKPDFLEKMLAFMQKNNLDVAACGNDFIDVKTNKLIGVRNLKQSCVLEGAGFGKNFPEYHQFMRTLWGKIYSLSVLLKPSYKNYMISSYGSDTIFAMKAFYNAKRVGIINESFHKYYISPKSQSYTFDKNRILSDKILFEAAYDFLISKCDTVNTENLNFLFLVYFNAIKDTIKILLNAKINVTEKLYNLHDIFESPLTQKIIQKIGKDIQNDELFGEVTTWVFSQSKVRSGIGMEFAADILAVMDIYPTQIPGWQDCWVFILLTKIKSSLAKKGASHKADASIISITSKSLLLTGMNADFLMYFNEIAFCVLRQNQNKALNLLKNMIEHDADIPDDYVNDFFLLGLNLSAKLKYSDDFIYFKKLQISLLIDFGKTDEAQKQLANWDEVLPDDVDFKELRERLM